MKNIWILATVVISGNTGEELTINDHFTSEAKAKKALASFKHVQSLGWIDEEIVEQYIYDKPLY